LLADTRSSEVLAHVVRAVGLTFSEFTRSVLLAQNEFTSFLKANDNERAAILEKLTGNEIFSKVGIKVFQNCSAKQAELNQLRLSLQTEQVLDDAALEALQHQVVADEARSAALVDIERSVQNLINLTNEREDKQRTITAQELQLQAAMQRSGVLQTTLVERGAALEDARKAQKEAQNTLAQAQGLDGQLSALRAQLLPLNEALRLKEGRLAELQAERLVFEQQQLAAQNKKNVIVLWQQENEPLRLWAENWAANENVLKTAEQRYAAAQEYNVAIASDQKLFTANLQSAEALAREIQALSVAQAERQATIESLAQHLQDKGDLSLLVQRVDDFESEKQRLMRFLNLADAVRINSERQQTCESHRAEQLKRTESARESLVALRAQAAILREQLQLAQQHREKQEIRVAGNLNLLRSQLVQGDPCPLCGATEHPLALHAVAEALDAAVQDARLRCIELETQLNSKTREAQAAEVEMTRAQTEASNSEKLLAELRHADAEYRAAAGEQGFSWPWRDDEVSLQLREKGKVEKLLEEARSALKLAQQNSQRLQNLQREYASIEQQRMEMQARKAQLSAQHATLDERIKGLTLQQSDAQRQVKEQLANLSHLGKIVGWENNPSAYRARIQRDVDAWRSRSEQLVEVESSLLGLAPKLEAQLQLLAEAEQSCFLQRAHRESLQIEINQLEKDFRQLLGGASIAQFSERLNQRILQSEAMWAAAENEYQQQQIVVAGLQGGLNETRQSIHDVEKTYNQERTRVILDAQRLDFPLGERTEAEYSSLLQEELRLLQKREVQAHAQMSADASARKRRADLLRKISGVESELLQWERLSKMIGSANGDKFRREAHRLTLEVLFAHANHHLTSIARRYQFRIPPQGQGILVEDLHFGGELRSVYSLSGGESFLLSLALAMGLASLSSEQIPVESLFIDEGFGSLDAETLKVALDALDALQSQGRKVGVISHVGDMAERIGVQIKVQQVSPGLSRVVLP
jgi:exonuclease SbcC